MKDSKQRLERIQMQASGQEAGLKVPLADLRAQYQELKTEMDAAVHERAGKRKFH